MSEAEKQLREHQQQLDADGVMVGVSRQALAEFMAENKALREHNDRLIRINHSEGVENQRLREALKEARDDFDSASDGAGVNFYQCAEDIRKTLQGQKDE